MAATFVLNYFIGVNVVWLILGTALFGVIKTLRPAVVSMIFAAGLGILIPTVFASGAVSFAAGNVQWRFVICFLGCLFVLRKWKPNPIPVMVIPGICELLFQVVLGG